MQVTQIQSPARFDPPTLVGEPTYESNQMVSPLTLRFARFTVLALATVGSATAFARQNELPAHSPKDLEQARVLYDEGLRHFNVAEYDDAITAFKSSYLHSGDASLLFNVGQAYRLKGDCDQAMRFYKNFLREKPDATNKEEVETAMHKCESTQPPAPAAAVPEVVQAPPPTVEPTYVSRTAPTTKDVGRNKRITGLAMMGAGAAVLGTGVYFGLRAHDKANDVENHTGEWRPSDTKTEESGQRLARVGQILTGVGVAGVLGGATLYLIGSSNNERRSVVALVPSDNGASLSWARQF